MIDLEALKKLERALEPGKWTATGRHIGREYDKSAIGECRCSAGNWQDNEYSLSHAAFIAAARNALPALIAELEESRKKIKNLENDLNEWKELYYANHG